MDIIECNLENLREEYALNYVARQANGAVLYRSEGTVMLASVTLDKELVEGDFLPLTVQYIEKSYAVGKFPGGFVKREGKPGEFETLNSRIIDRTLRPIFPKGYRYPTQITVMTLSYDRKSDLAICALNAAANALYLSNLPFYHIISAVRIGRIRGEFVINPSMQELKESSLDLYVSGRGEEILMIEMRSLKTELASGANEISEEELLEALKLAKTTISRACRIYEEAFFPHKKPPLVLSFNVEEKNLEICEYIYKNYFEQIKHVLVDMAKSERNEGFGDFFQHILDAGTSQEWKADQIKVALDTVKRQIVRDQIIEEKRRIDNRSYEEVRSINIQTNILPFAHGSALFTRGQTQALVVATIGVDSDAQIQELLGDKVARKEKFVFHYNFPGFSVGEASPIGSPGRRELGHGNLAKRALEASVVDTDQSIRLVSEILESNGSSSMASVCGGSLALCASGVKVSSLVAGVAMGLVKEGEKYAILSDINGLEDYNGDMDFKIAGSRAGITAMQMDIKFGGISHHILKETLYQAKRSREHILSIMEKAREEIILNTDVLPSIEVFSVHPSKIVEIIGQGGKTIKEIIEKFGVSIDLDRESGEVKVCGSHKEDTQGVKDFILNLITEQKNNSNQYEVGQIFEGEVKKILDFGVFVSLPSGGDGLVHISKITRNRTESIKDYMQEGHRLKCRILGFNKGKIELDLIK